MHIYVCDSLAFAAKTQATYQAIWNDAELITGAECKVDIKMSGNLN